jgi:hypothetical protein
MSETQRVIEIQIAPKMQEKICKLRYMKNMISYIVGVEGTSVPLTWLANVLTGGNIHDMPAFCAALDAMEHDYEIERENGFVRISGKIRVIEEREI